MTVVGTMILPKTIMVNAQTTVLLAVILDLYARSKTMFRFVLIPISPENLIPPPNAPILPTAVALPVAGAESIVLIAAGLMAGLSNVPTVFGIAVMVTASVIKVARIRLFAPAPLLPIIPSHPCWATFIVVVKPAIKSVVLP